MNQGNFLTCSTSSNESFYIGYYKTKIVECFDQIHDKFIKPRQNVLTETTEKVNVLM